MKVISWVLLVNLMFAGSGSAQSRTDEAQANPGRPTVSTPATLTPVGYLQFETGFLAARHSPEFASRHSANGVLKLSVAPRLELISASDSLVFYRADRRSSVGTGEVFLGGQAVVKRGEGVKPTIAVSYFRRIYDGGVPELDFGSPRNSFLVLASGDVMGFHYDGNVLFNEQTEQTLHRAQFGQTLSIAHRLAGNFSVSGEIWHFTQPFLRGHAAGNLWAVSYAARKTLVFDVGFNRGLTRTSTRWEVFAGFTYLLPRRLW